MIQGTPIIAAYPRSGSTYLRWLLTACDTDINVPLSYEYVNHRCPTIESENEMLSAHQQIVAYKTHQLRTGPNIVHLVRHVGDVLISEYHFMRKFSAYKKTIGEFLHENNYGANWRQLTEHYFAYPHIKYEDMLTLWKGKLYFFVANYFGSHASLLQSAMRYGDNNDGAEKMYEKFNQYLAHRTSVEVMRKAEKKGFGELGRGKRDIHFVREARFGQWRDLPEELQAKILAHNARHLKLYNYQIQ